MSIGTGSAAGHVRGNSGSASVINWPGRSLAAGLARAPSTSTLPAEIERCRRARLRSGNSRARNASNRMFASASVTTSSTSSEDAISDLEPRQPLPRVWLPRHAETRRPMAVVRCGPYAGERAVRPTGHIVRENHTALVRGAVRE